MVNIILIFMGIWLSTISMSLEKRLRILRKVKIISKEANLETAVVTGKKVKVQMFRLRLPSY